MKSWEEQWGQGGGSNEACCVECLTYVLHAVLQSPGVPAVLKSRWQCMSDLPRFVWGARIHSMVCLQSLSDAQGRTCLSPGLPE